jgi:hypothetical protein
VSDAQANDADAAIALIQQAMEKIHTLPDTPEERVSADGITVMLESVITRIAALGSDEGE